MRRYKAQLAIIFSVFFLILSVAMVLFYLSITNNFISNKAKENLENYNIGISSIVEVELTNNYNAYKDIVDDMILNSENPLDGLTNLNTYDLIGVVGNTSMSINGISYPFLPQYTINNYFDQPIAIYSPSYVLSGNSDETTYLVFSYQGYNVFIEANNYFETILANYQNLEGRFFIINSDGYTYLDETNDFNTLTFGSGLSESDRDDLFSSIHSTDNLHQVFEVTFDGSHSFLAYARMSAVNHDYGFYFIELVGYHTLINSMSYLTNSLMFAFAVIFILFLFGLLMLYRMIQIRNEDIESARLIHYYVKPNIIKINGKGKIISYNQSFKKLVKKYKHYRTIQDFQLRDGGEIQLEKLKKQEPFVVKLDLESGTKYIRFIPIKYALTYALVGDDITQLEETYKYHREIAFYNDITKEPNMNYMKADLKTLLIDPKQVKHKNALVIFGIFKYGDITKVIGEKLSGEVLVYVAETVKKTLIPFGATLYHISFDRFGILFQNLDKYEDVSTWADALISAFEKPIDVDKNKFALQFRIGQFNMDFENVSEMNEDKVYDNAILALNKASAFHSQKPVVYDITFGQNLSRRQVIETDMMTAIDQHEFVMYLQPQYNLNKERIIGFEALVRWDNPKYKLDSPSEFIEIAENNNMIIDIGRIVMNETFRIAKELESYDIKISMNISPVQILQAGFVSELINAFESYELKEHSISIEITETFLMTSFDMIIEKLKLLQSRGFDIHLDDFGTGYSSLLYLKELPINAIKIDKEFTLHSTADKHSRAIINMIISLAKNLDLEIIAEGVEDDKQFKFLQKSGCDIIQGFYIGKAMKVEDAISLLKAYNIDRTAIAGLRKR